MTGRKVDGAGDVLGTSYLQSYFLINLSLAVNEALKKTLAREEDEEETRKRGGKVEEEWVMVIE